jgi:hypothetical protein
MNQVDASLARLFLTVKTSKLWVAETFGLVTPVLVHRRLGYANASS